MIVHVANVPRRFVEDLVLCEQEEPYSMEAIEDNRTPLEVATYLKVILLAERAGECDDYDGEVVSAALGWLAEQEDEDLVEAALELGEAMEDEELTEIGNLDELLDNLVSAATE